MNKSGTIQAWIAAVFALGIVVWLHFSVFDKPITLDYKDPSEKLDAVNTSTSGTDDGIRKSIEALNSTCPRQMDSETRLDSALYQPGNVFAEYYTLVNLERATMDTADMKTKIGENILSRIKTSAAFTLFKNSNYTFSFIYKDKAQKHLFDVVIGPSQYNN